MAGSTPRCGFSGEKPLAPAKYKSEIVGLDDDYGDEVSGVIGEFRTGSPGSRLFELVQISRGIPLAGF